MLEQSDFNGHDKIQASIELIRQYEPPEGYFLAFSGGKDSIVLLDLAAQAGAKFDTHYNRTGIDPPELIKFIREHYPDVDHIPPIMTMWEGILIHGLPLRIRRWCCQVLKEHSGAGRLNLVGIRWAESVSRSKRPVYYKYDAARAKQKYIKDKEFLLPIANWTDAEIWQYIRLRGLPYCELYDQGFDRLGCVLCPFVSGAKLQRELDRYPKIAEAYRRAANRYYERRKDALGFPSGDDYYFWWLTREKRAAQKGGDFMTEIPRLLPW